LLADILQKKSLDDDLKKRIGDALQQYKDDFLQTHDKVGAKKEAKQDEKQAEPVGAKA
jgi:hypothetical protein